MPDDMGSYYQMGLDRIAIGTPIYHHEATIIDDVQNGHEDPSTEASQSYNILYRIILHEMIHREVGEYFGEHGAKFRSTCIRAYEQLGSKKPDFRNPREGELNNWPF